MRPAAAWATDLEDGHQLRAVGEGAAVDEGGVEELVAEDLAVHVGHAAPGAGLEHGRVLPLQHRHRVVDHLLRARRQGLWQVDLLHPLRLVHLQEQPLHVVVALGGVDLGWATGSPV